MDVVKNYLLKCNLLVFSNKKSAKTVKDGNLKKSSRDNMSKNLQDYKF